MDYKKFYAHFKGYPDDTVPNKVDQQLVRAPCFHDWKQYEARRRIPAEDRAAIGVHDVGLRVNRDDKGDVQFDVYAGGGLGRTPVLGALVRSELPIEHLLTYLEALMRVYNRYGRRDNKYKARIKILVRAMGVDGFRAKVDEEWAHSFELGH